MSCESWGPLLAAEIYGDNSKADQQALKEHLTACASCRAQLEIWRTALAPTSSRPAQMDESFWILQKASIMARLPERSSGGWLVRGRLPAGWLAPVLAMGLMVMGGWGLHRHSVRRDFPIAQNMELLQNMDMLSHLDVLEAMDQTEEQ